MQAARAAGAVVSFNLIAREKLWNISGRAKEHTREVLGDRCECGCLSRQRRRPAKRTFITGPEVTTKSKLDPTEFLGMIDQVLIRYPRLKQLLYDAEKYTPLTGIHGEQHHGSTGQPPFSLFANWKCMTELAGAMALQQDFFTGLYREF